VGAAGVRVVRRSCAPKFFPCPQCGTPGRRKDTHARSVRALPLAQVAVIELTVGEYRPACACGHWSFADQKAAVHAVRQKMGRLETMP
jgi:transposase